MTTTLERPPWRTLDVSHGLPLYQLCPGFLHAIELNGEILKEGTIARMGIPRCKDLGYEPQIVVDIMVGDVTFFVLVRDISDRMSNLNATTLRAATYGHVSVDAIYDALWAHSFGRWVDRRWVET